MDGLGSPSKPARGRGSPTRGSQPIKQEEPHENRVAAGSVPQQNGRNGLGLTEGSGNGRLSFGPGSAPAFNLGPPHSGALPISHHDNKDDDDDDDGGIDLAKGFAPISSFSSQRGGGMATKS